MRLDRISLLYFMFYSLDRTHKMAAQRAVVLENHTKLFVEAKVGERIKMEFTTGQVQIKPESKHGSTTLGAFWVRVVQAYFPREEFSYTKRYCQKYGSESISVSCKASEYLPMIICTITRHIFSAVCCSALHVITVMASWICIEVVQHGLDSQPSKFNQNIGQFFLS